MNYLSTFKKCTLSRRMIYLKQIKMTLLFLQHCAQVISIIFNLINKITERHLLTNLHICNCNTLE